MPTKGLANAGSANFVNFVSPGTDEDEQQLVRQFIEGMLLKHEAKHWINHGDVA